MHVSRDQLPEVLALVARNLREVAAKMPGFLALQVYASLPRLRVDGERVVAVLEWESREAVIAAIYDPRFVANWSEIQRQADPDWAVYAAAFAIPDAISELLLDGAPYEQRVSV
jgi:heme-degrading monooxygenase HmoA